MKRRRKTAGEGDNEFIRRLVVLGHKYGMVPSIEFTPIAKEPAQRPGAVPVQGGTITYNQAGGPVKLPPEASALLTPDQVVRPVSDALRDQASVLQDEGDRIESDRARGAALTPAQVAGLLRAVEVERARDVRAGEILTELARVARLRDAAAVREQIDRRDAQLGGLNAENEALVAKLRAAEARVRELEQRPRRGRSRKG